MESIQVVNQAQNLTDSDLARFVAAIQIQVTRDFAPVWNEPATITALTKTAPTDPAAMQVFMVDTIQSVAPGALAYHTITSLGKPVGYVGVNDVIADAVSAGISAAQGISTALSHEILEALADPDINLLSSDPTTNTTALYANEVADPVENDAYDYTIDLGDGKPPVYVSNFITPAWFQGFWKSKPANQRPAFDFRHVLTMPFQVAPLGYAIVLAPRSARWTVVFGKELKRKVKMGAKKFLASAPAFSRKGKRTQATMRAHHKRTSKTTFMGKVRPLGKGKPGTPPAPAAPATPAPPIPPAPPPAGK